MPLENFSKETYKNKLLFGNEMKSWASPFLTFFFPYLKLLRNIFHPTMFHTAQRWVSQEHSKPMVTSLTSRCLPKPVPKKIRKQHLKVVWLETTA